MKITISLQQKNGNRYLHPIRYHHSNLTKWQDILGCKEGAETPSICREIRPALVFIDLYQTFREMPVVLVLRI